MIAQHGQGYIRTHTVMERGSGLSSWNVATGADICRFGVSIIIRKQSRLILKKKNPLSTNLSEGHASPRGIVKAVDLIVGGRGRG